MEMSWPLVAQIIVLAYALALLIPGWLYLNKRAVDRAGLARDREQGIIPGQAVIERKPPPAHDD